jgi:surface antigen
VITVLIAGGKGGAGDPGDDYPAQWKNRPMDSVLDQWREYNRECTSFTAWALYSRNGFNMPFYDNANKWGPDAAKRGYAVNSTPAVGSVAWSNAGTYGHVAYVVAVGGGNVTIEEYNRNYTGTYDKRTVAASAFTGYIHFKDAPPEYVSPPSTPPAPTPTPSSPSPPTTTPPTTPPTPSPSAPAGAPTPAPAPTYVETTGGVTHTWTNYTNAGGTQGPSIPSNTTVQIACRVSGFRVEDGNTWWYRIASSPWSGAFYASADAFYNNGATSGSLKGTPFVDPAVPGC